MPFHGIRTDTPREWQADAPLDPASWVPIADLALEGFGHAETLDVRVKNLSHDLAEEVILDDIGRACVPRSVARQMFAARTQSLLDAEAQRAAEAAQAKLRGHPIRDRIRALRERETLGDPLADMKRDEIHNDWEKAAERRDEITRSEQTGRLQYHSIREQEK